MRRRSVPANPSTPVPSSARLPGIASLSREASLLAAAGGPLPFDEQHGAHHSATHRNSILGENVLTLASEGPFVVARILPKSRRNPVEARPKCNRLQCIGMGISLCVLTVALPSLPGSSIWAWTPNAMGGSMTGKHYYLTLRPVHCERFVGSGYRERLKLTVIVVLISVGSPLSRKGW